MKFRWYSALPAFVALALAFMLAFVLIDDYDVWWHLKCGELFLRNWTIPRNEIFSYTAAGRQWVDGYLPAQVILYLAWRMAGPAGVCALSAILVTAAYAIALAISRKSSASYGIALAVSLPAIFLARVVMIPRPALLSPIFALIALWLLEDHRLNGGRRIYWILPLTALWANCHPGFPFGMIITFVYIIGSLFNPRPGYPTLTAVPRLAGRGQGGISEPTETGGHPALKRDPPLRNKLIALLGMQLIATLINPYGHRIYYSAFSFLANPQMRNVIIEWKPLYGEPDEPPGVIQCFVAVVAIWFACSIWRGRKIRVEHALLFVVVGLSTLFGRRNLIMFGPLSIPLIAWTVGKIRGHNPTFKRDNSATELGIVSPNFPGGSMGPPLRRFYGVLVKTGAALIIVTGLFLIWAAGTNRLYASAGSFRATGVGVQKAMFPDAAVELLQKERIKGNIFNTYGLGGYLIFKLYPKYRVFIDGRMYPYPYDLFAQVSTLNSEKVFNNIKVRYDIRGMILPLYPTETWGMIYAFMTSPNWAIVAADGSGVLFLARGAGNDEIIGRYEMNLLAAPPLLESRAAPKEIHWWSRVEYPYGPIRWAKFYEQIGRVDLAAEALKPALNFRPLVANLEAWLGDLLIQANKLEEGNALVQKELDRDPENFAGLSGRADYLIAKGEYDKAEEILFNMLRRRPDLAQVWDTLGEISYNRRDFTTAVRRFERAVLFAPNEMRYWERLGVARQVYDAPGAIAAYRRALEIGRKGGALPEDIKRIQENLNRIEKQTTP